VNDDLEKEKEKMMKALKNKGTPAREGEQT
jgi:hypothetical protein